MTDDDPPRGKQRPKYSREVDAAIIRNYYRSLSTAFSISSLFGSGILFGKLNGTLLDKHNPRSQNSAVITFANN